MHQSRRPLRTSLVCFVASLFVLLSIGSITPAPPGSGSGQGGRIAPSYVPGELLIKFKGGTGPSEHANARAQVHAQRLRQFRGGAEHWKLSGVETTASAIARLQNNPHVLYVEPNYLVGVKLVPNDPRYSELYALRNQGQTGGTPGADIRAENAWSVSTGSRSVVVGVIDTGVDTSHPDLLANIWTNPGEVPGNGVDDDANGFIDDVHGWDFRNHDNNPFDDYGHGTHVSGTIGAVGNNGVGVTGVSWQVSIMALKFIGADGYGTDADAIAAIDYATAMGAQILNNSWGGGGYSQALLDAINAAGAANILFVAAAGNDGSNTDLFPHYPSSFNAPSIVSVAATDANDHLAFFSNYGAATVDLGAPGVDILSTLPQNSYGLNSGTSMATPLVSGAAALILAVAPEIDVATLKRLLLESADPTPALAGKCVTGGRLNAFRPIAIPDDTPPGAVGGLAAGNPEGGAVTLSWTATGDDGDVGTASSYEVRYSDSPIDDANFALATVAPGAPNPALSGAPEQMRVTGLDFSTLYYFAVKARDEFGNAGPLSNVASAITLGPPEVQVAPTSVSASLLTGGTATQVLTISNNGVSDLEYHVGVRRSGGGAEPAQVLPPQSAPRSPLDLPGVAPVTNTTVPPADYQPRLTGIATSPGATVLLIQDFAPWETNSNEEVLEANGIAYEMISSSALASKDLSPYALVIVPSDQPTSYYLTLAGLSAKLDSYVAAGGVLEFHAAGWGWANGDASQVTLPGGMRINFYLSNTNHVLDPSHPMVAGVPDPFSGFASHAYFTSIPPGAAHIVSDDTGRTNLAVYNFGVGTVIASCQTLEYGYRYGFPSGTILRNMIPYAFSHTPRWISRSPTSGVVAPGDSDQVTLTFDAARLVGGVYAADVVVSSNDPLASETVIPATLTVTGAPDLAILGEEVSVDSVQTYTTDNAGTSHALPVSVQPEGGGTLRVLVDGDFGFDGETATVTVEGTILGTVGAGGSDCSPYSRTFSLSPGLLANLVADGRIDVQIQNSPEVGAFCSTNSHSVHLQYSGPAESLDFGPLFIGLSRSMALTLKNDGTDLLLVNPIGTDSASFSASASNLSLQPGASVPLTVTFNASAVGDFTGNLSITSNDPDTPLVTIPLTGQGVTPPVVSAEPPTLGTTLFTGGREDQNLRLVNTGGSPLEFHLSVVPRQGDGGTCVPTRAFVAEYNGGRLSAVSLGTGAKSTIVSGLSSPYGVATQVGGSTVYVAEYGNGELSAVDLSTGAVRTVTGGVPGILKIALEANGARAFVTRYNGSLSSVDLTTGTVVNITTGLRAPYGVALDPTGTEALVAEFDTGRLARVNLATGVTTRTVSGLQGPVGLALDRTGTIAYVTEWSTQTLRAITLATGATQLVATGLNRPLGITLDPAGTTAYVTEDAGDIAVVNLATGSVGHIGSGLATPLGIALDTGVGCQPIFVSLEPSSGSVPAMSSLDILARFDAHGLFGGAYLNDIQLASNDPVTPLLTVPASLTVIGAPDINAQPGSLAFPVTFIDHSSTLSLKILNRGTDPLHISGVRLEGEFGQTGLTPPETIPIGGSRNITVTFSPTVPGAATGRLILDSDDPDMPGFAVPLAGSALVPPRAEVSPPSVSAVLNSGDSATQVLTLRNTGGSDLSWFVDAIEVSESAVTAEPPPNLVKGQPDPRPGILGGGGPDRFGYRWKDSDAPGGPEFSWTDISATGTAVPIYGDDVISDPIPIGFDFSFYGNSFTSVRVCTNGFLSFTSSIPSYSNQPLPSAYAPENLLAIFWSDLYVETPQSIRYLNDGNRWIVQFTNVRFLGGSGPMTFQVILHPNGQITYQYEHMEGFFAGPTTGIQNSARDDGLTVAFNTNYVHDNLAVRFTRTPEWLSMTPTAGTVPAGGSVSLEARMNAAGMLGGEYHSRIRLTSNDPVNGLLEVPATLTVIGVPDIDAQPASLTFPTTFTGTHSSLSLTVLNTGTDALHISGVRLEGEFSQTGLTPPETIPIGGSRNIIVTFSPTVSGIVSGRLILDSDDPDEASLEVSLTGSATPRPVLGIAPSSLHSTLLNGGQEAQALTLTNTGGSDLTFSLRVNVLAGEAVHVAFAGLSPDTSGAPNHQPSAAAPSPSVAFSPDQGVPGDFEQLAPSPVPLTSVVADPAAMTLYAQANNGTGFYRYRATSNVWEPLASSPITSGNNGGAALLNGKIYTVYTENSFSLGVYDIAANSWTTLPNPLDYGTGNIASDGSRYLYLIYGNQFVRFDPAAGSSTFLPTPPFWFSHWGGLRFLSGRLYGHEGDGSSGFARFDIASNGWTLLPSIFGGAVLGSEINPLSRQYIAYGSYGGTNLYRFSISSGAWSVSTLPFFSANDGGMGWLPGPVAGIYFVQGENGTGFARLITEAPFLSVSPLSGTVPAGGSAEIEALFEAGGLFGGVYNARIDITSNDPEHLLTSVPASLTVIGAPSINAQPASLTFPSTFQGYSRSLPLTVSNQGTEVLHITGVRFEGEFSQTGLTPPETIPIGGSRNITVTFSPTVSGAASGRLILDSDDPDEPALAVPLTGTSIVPPVAEVQPASLHSQLPLHGAETQTLTLTNTGGSDLTFTLRVGAPTSEPGGPGTFERLPSSPVALACAVEDPDNQMIYAQAYGTASFYRYRATSNTWETLPPAVLGYFCTSAALLNGKIYTTYYSSGGLLGVYDIASNTWTTRSNPVGSSGGLIASDGNRYLYLLAGTFFRRLDPESGAITGLPDPPISVLSGGMRHFSGKLYVHQGDGTTGFASFDTAANTWSVLPSLPGNANMGSAIDPVAREYFATGYCGPYVFRYSIDSGEWRVESLQLFGICNGGMAWLPGPVAGIYFTAGNAGTGFARMITVAPFLSFSNSEGTVPPGGSTEIQVQFGAGGLGAGTYNASINVATNDPAHSLIPVPSTLQVYLDTDQDGLGDPFDNCPAVYNPAQENADGDQAGDACDLCTDTDGDGAGNPGYPANTCQIDNCPGVANPAQVDRDGDGLGDACDACPDDAGNDLDGDGICSALDNCPGVSNAGQENADGDGLGDACDACPTDPGNDADADGVCGNVDNCPGASNLGQEDTDLDGPGDACDNCPATVNPDQQDANADGSGDACQPVLALNSIQQDGGSALEVRAIAGDPQGDPLSGSVQIYPMNPPPIVLPDAIAGGWCESGLLLDGVPGEGIGYLNIVGGAPFLFDLDSTLGCADISADFEIAPGTCLAPAGPFETIMDLSTVVLPAAICVRKTSAPEAVFDFTITALDESSITLLPAPASIPLLAYPFSAWPPRGDSLTSLAAGESYRMKLTITDGNCVPVSAEGTFAYQGEPVLIVNNPPTASAVAASPVECDRPGGGLAILDGSASHDPDSSPGSHDDIVRFDWVLDAGAPSELPLGTGEVLPVVMPLGSHAVTLRITDASGESDAAIVAVNIVDTTAPVLTCSPAATLECTSPIGASATVTAAASDACSSGVEITNSRNGSAGDASGAYPLGASPVTFTATDASGNIATCATGVTVRDTVPPVLTFSTSQVQLWPANHRLVPIPISWQVTDLCTATPSAVLASATSNELDNAPGDGDGDTTGDIAGADLGTADTQVSVRAERDEAGSGRTYDLRYESADAAGNVSTGSVIVRVPHDNAQGHDPVHLRLQPGATMGSAWIFWDPVPGATGYDLIVGDLANVKRKPSLLSLGQVTVLATGTQATDYPEAPGGPTPGVGKAWFFLMQYRQADGTRSGYGSVFAPLPREPDSCGVACP